MEHMPIDMIEGPTDPLDALAILDFLCGDEWAGITESYANTFAIDAIILAENAGVLDPKYHPLRERLLYGQQ